MPQSAASLSYPWLMRDWPQIEATTMLQLGNYEWMPLALELTACLYNTITRVVRISCIPIAFYI